MPMRKKILIVEDNHINRAMLGEILSGNYQVLEAEDGQKALDVLAVYGVDISLILLDIVMPVMDGYTFLSIVKANPDYSAIPVIVTTQSDGESDEVAALAHGATDFVAKPYKPQVILHRVASIINLRETAAMINQFQYDSLTGLYSKEFFYQRAKERLQQSPGEYDIICSDIENFKLINDIFGIQTGDRLLCGVADLYREFVGKGGICGRINADQFACLVEHRRDYANELFLRMGERINDLASAKNVVLKWGVYAVEERTVSVERMCDRALLAARSIKGQYGKYFAAYDDALRGKLLREQAISEGMEAALAEEQFLIYLQGKYRIRDHRLAGAEALVRWNHPEWGFQSPAEFIPLFEKNGFITKLDQYVWDRACAVLREWEDKGYPPLPISVNVSRADIYNADIAEILVKTVEKYGLQTSQLHLEITESAYTENPEQIIDTVRHLRELGFVIEMDDFGSGYSSLNMINQMPLDILKLDMKFIQSETAKPADQGVLRFIMELARWMNLSVVAEGVETKEQLARLQEAGCDYVQGYYFAKPVPCRDFEGLIRKDQEDGDREALYKDPKDEDAGAILLVADEEAQYRAEVRQTFQHRFRIVEVDSGAEALDCISVRHEEIAAVILSLTLTQPDGLSVLETLQRERQLWDIPVIVTGPRDEEQEARVLEIGAEDFAAKPHSQRALRRRVMRALANSSTRERERELKDEACQDYLTGLLNRRGWNEAVAAIRKEDMPLAVYLFDMDDLKVINDTLGHVEGDRLLQQFAVVLRAHTRKSDILARFGGDEFIVAMKQMGSAQAAFKKGEEICQAFRQVDFSSQIQAACTAGITVGYPEDSLDELITQADRALYFAKQGGKGGCGLHCE